MRTSRLARWLIGGALIAAGVVAAHGGQAAGAGDVQAIHIETSEPDVVSHADTYGEAQLDDESFEWG